MVVDTSAIIAIFAQESDAALFEERIADERSPSISVVSVLECSIVLRSLRQNPPAQCESWLDDFLARSRFTLEATTADDAHLARQAHVRFGKGTGHAAQLNFGDCF